MRKPSTLTLTLTLTGELTTRMRFCSRQRPSRRASGSFEGHTRHLTCHADDYTLPRVAPLFNARTGEQMGYKMIVMVEGNDVASGLKWALLSSSAVLMPAATIVTWAMESELVPWVHYVPLRQDCADLEEKATWCLANLAACERIGINGQCFAAQFLHAEREARVSGFVMDRVAEVVRGVASCGGVCATNECPT